MSWPALRTVPVRLREAGFGPFAAGVQGALLGVPLALAALGLVVVLVATPIRFLAGAEPHLGSLLTVPIGVLWFGLVGAVIVVPALLVALVLAALAARAGWAGWLVAIMSGVLVGALAGAASSASLASAFRLEGEAPTFGALGAIYGAAFWLSARWMHPHVFRLGRERPEPIPPEAPMSR